MHWKWGSECSGAHGNTALNIACIGQCKLPFEQDEPLDALELKATQHSILHALGSASSFPRLHLAASLVVRQEGTHNMMTRHNHNDIFEVAPRGMHASGGQCTHMHTCNMLQVPLLGVTRQNVPIEQQEYKLVGGGVLELSWPTISWQEILGVLVLGENGDSGGAISGWRGRL